VLDRPDLAAQPEFSTNLARVEHRRDVDALVAEAFARRPSEELRRLLDDAALAYAEVNDMEGVATHPALLERGALGTVPTAGGVEVTTLIGMAERLFGVTGGRVRPPGVGEDTADVLTASAADDDLQP
jgi:crotonobetainyl-CoA:carnitine CoA-transferase CaiB-like acyl-CoA transferase